MKKNKKQQHLITDKRAKEVQAELVNSLNEDVEYSLEVDPTNKYNLSDEQKRFIKNYVNFKSIMAASEFSEISPEQGKQFFVSYATQQEIRRLNKALYHRQFANKLLSLDEIGGYLTSILTDDVVLADQLKSNDKIKVAQMIIDLNKLKLEALSNNPSVVMNKDLDEELQHLSVDTIKRLLETNDSVNLKEKKDVINQFEDSNKMSLEEKAYLESLSTKDLLEILDSKGEKKDDK